MIHDSLANEILLLLFYWFRTPTDMLNISTQQRNANPREKCWFCLFPDRLTELTTNLTSCLQNPPELTPWPPHLHCPSLYPSVGIRGHTGASNHEHCDDVEARNCLAKIKSKAWMDFQGKISIFFFDHFTIANQFISTCFTCGDLRATLWTLARVILGQDSPESTILWTVAPMRRRSVMNTDRPRLSETIWRIVCHSNSDCQTELFTFSRNCCTILVSERFN